jgi:hypothetical protein
VKLDLIFRGAMLIGTGMGLMVLGQCLKLLRLINLNIYAILVRIKEHDEPFIFPADHVPFAEEEEPF